MSATNLYALVLLIALAFSYVGKAVAESADLPGAPEGVGPVGMGLMTIGVGAGISVFVLWAGPAVIDGLDTISCWRDHSISTCAMNGR